MTTKGVLLRMAVAILDRLPASVRTSLQRGRAVAGGLGQLKRNQAMLAGRLARLETAALGPLGADETEDPRFPPGIRSRICTEAQLYEPWFSESCASLHEEVKANRKLWEHAYITHVLNSLGALRPGNTALGFGVGREPLVSLFAGNGIDVVATDLDAEHHGARGWTNTNQHAMQGMLHPDLCSPEKFAARVTWRPVDMRTIPIDLFGFDFCWSACALEHLGSLQAGLDFVAASLETLKPGGIAVHTTEFNLGSNDATVDSGRTVLYRARDLLELCDRLEKDGHEVATLDLSSGQGVLDEYIDLPPYVDEPHLHLLYRKFITTSVALVIRTRGESG